MAIDTRQANLRLSWEEDDELVVSLTPLQGHWTEEQYLLVSDQTNRLLEFDDGYIQVLPMPTQEHQDISQVLFYATHFGVMVTGVDISLAMVAVARARAARAGLAEQTRFLEGDSQSLPFPDHSFDAVINACAVGIPDDSQQVLNEILLRSAGHPEVGIPYRPRRSSCICASWCRAALSQPTLQSLV